MLYMVIFFGELASPLCSHQDGICDKTLLDFLGLFSSLLLADIQVEEHPDAQSHISYGLLFRQLLRIILYTPHSESKSWEILSFMLISCPSFSPPAPSRAALD